MPLNVSVSPLQCGETFVLMTIHVCRCVLMKGLYFLNVRSEMVNGSVCWQSTPGLQEVASPEPSLTYSFFIVLHTPPPVPHGSRSNDFSLIHLRVKHFSYPHPCEYTHTRPYTCACMHTNTSYIYQSLRRFSPLKMPLRSFNINIWRAALSFLITVII